MSMQVDSSVFSPRAMDTAPATTASSQTAKDATQAAIDSTSALANENTFLQLLVAQIKNQDPTQPMDSTTFLTQLAQFSQLEQLIGIRQDVSNLGATAPAATDTKSS
jgi:flagellar basal-body rod modification protein FlgD